MTKFPRYLKLALFLAIAIVVAFIGGSAALFSPEVERFSSYSQLRIAGLVDKGWVPEFLPEDAFEIMHQHDLDTSESATEFSYVTSFIPKIKGQLRPVPHALLEKRRREAEEIEWAFPHVNGAQYFEIQSSDMDVVLVIDDVSKRALYWTSRKRAAQ